LFKSNEWMLLQMYIKSAGSFISRLISEALTHS
jgi:hypothetical protein